MSNYHYGPPPPAPAAAPPSGGGGYPQFQSQQGGRGGFGGRGGRGGHQGPGGYGGYNGGAPQPQQGFGGPGPQFGPPQTGYAPGPGGGYPQQQWQGGRGGPQPMPIAAQNYHPNYAQHMYPQAPNQPPYGQQGSNFGGPQAQQYGPGYPQQGPGPQQQQWSGSPPHGQHPPQFGAGRGGHGGQAMGPPIRLGFENGSTQDRNAPVSGSYPQPGYSGSESGPFPPAPYQAYPTGGAPVVNGSTYNQGNRHGSWGSGGRGGHNNHNNPRGRSSNGDKGRHHNDRKHSNNTQSNTSNNQHQKPDAATNGKKKKRKTNTLGLTPGNESDDDDVDEEAKLAELIGNEAVQPDDMAAWLEERRRNFPTRARVEAKLAETTQAVLKFEESAKDAKTLALERKQQKAEKLRRELEKVESSLKRKREQQDAGDEFRDSPSESSSSSESEDEKPEVMSAKRDVVESYPPPARKADPTKHCKYYSTGGVCGKKGKCRFVHDPQVRAAALRDREMNGGKMTLSQRLILNDKEQEDLAIVKTLQYLKEKGVIDGSRFHNSDGSSKVNGHASATGASDDPGKLLDAAKAASQPPKPSSLPPPPASGLPAPPPMPTQRYQGWNLSGFGNTGVKMEDA